MTDLSMLADDQRQTENRGRKAAIKGAESATAPEKQIPPLAEVILMHFAVAFHVSRGSDDDSFFYFH